MMKRLNKKLMKMMMRMMPSCEVISHRISESYDRELSRRERLSIRIHTLGCKLCERYRRQLMVIHDLLKQYSVEDNVKSNIVLSEEVKVRIKEQLQELPRN